MGELGAEAQVGVQEVEQEVERPLLDKVGDEPEHIQGVPKKRTFRMLLELSRAASGNKVTLSRNLAKVTLPEAALLSSNSILKVRFFWDTM